ncbi:MULTISPECIES: DUF6515 family protein [Pseudomonas]|jgi:hypothetical protein|uniref:DUF6515 family protein n=1 Tax=Pseudomonas TaxID=286 RepID=UPI00222EDDAC|nr:MULTISPECIES: DUF6515 family protein [Pseudomonas]MDN3219919.1 glycine zipper family protein [Pseudomonas nunensis]UZE11249.1 glycine zipper family protein [Pseudomonas sp. B21-053]
MKSRIWRLAGVGLLCVSVTAQSLADEPQNRGPEGVPHGRDHERNDQGHGGNNQPRPQNNPQQNNQPRPQNNPQQNQPRQQNNEIIRGDNSRQFEHNGQNQNGQWQNRQPRDANTQVRPAPPPPQLPANSLPIQGRPDTVRQTQQPRYGNYQDIPRRNDNNQHWQGNNQGPRPDDHRWEGRPNGHGNGWGPGPQYRPGQMVDRFPDRNFRVPYRGQDYFYSGGYWYRPQGPRYVVVQPPRGIRVHYMPDYAREVWIGGALLFLAAGSYYAYEESTQDYVVVEPPVGAPQPQPTSNGIDVTAYPANGQSPQQVAQDGYECSQYAVQQSGFNPQTATYQPDPSVVQAYRQAQGNCLSSRGYQVTF